MHIVIFTGGDFHNSPFIEKVVQKADLLVAADSGAKHALNMHKIPDAVIGDMDSINKEIFHGIDPIKIIKHPTEKDETDTELAIDYAVQKGATEITILGGISGDRFDHIVGNLLLSLVCPVLITFLDGNQEVFIQQGPTSFTLKGKKGDLLSLIPLQIDVDGITSDNLYYPLHNSTLTFGKPRGISNVFTKDTITLAFARGTLCVVWTKN